MVIKICLAGATGWVGKSLVPAIYKDKDLKLTGAVSRKSSGKNLAGLFDLPDLNLSISSSVAEALKNGCDVLVDYTKPENMRPLATQNLT